jgi:signal transduction histidine kinase
VRLLADASLLAQLLENLFGNSLDHGGGGTVTVGATAEGFCVADEGPGIVAADRERVFDVGFSASTTGGNTGMGLAIVRKIAGVHGWSVRLTDARTPTESASRGVRFEFEGVELDP